MIGQTISHFKILEKLGQGGMGVVYKAEDTKLDRTVALKFLPPHLQAGEQEKARFVQEAKAAAALNHPNICSVFDIDEVDDRMFIVMEYVGGQTLREKQGSLTFKQAIDVGIQIADGLAAAHEKGIVHRDIKPENIMLRKDGIAQIMDFGLAKLRGTVSRLTKEGSTVGTAGYMSPEQVQGQEADHRSDIFSFGVLLYELLAGQLPFKGVHDTALAYEIVNVDPAPMSSVKPEIDPNLDAIVLECLEKDPNERTQSVRQVSVDLKRYRRESSRQRVSRVTAVRPSYQPSAVRSAGQPGSAEAVRPSRIAVLAPWILVAVLAAGLAVVALFTFHHDAVTPPMLDVSIIPPEHWSYDNTEGGHIALSPDGTMLAFVATDSGGRGALWLRRLATASPLLIPETGGATYPFWSPDNRYIAFFASGKLKKVAVAGGSPVSICDAPTGRGGTWNQSGIILFSPKFDLTGIYRVSAAGGEAVPATALDTSRNESNHRWPYFLPDGVHFIFTTQARARTPEYSGALYLASLEDKTQRLLAKISSNVALSGGALLYVRQGSIVAQPFDWKKGEFTGDAAPVAEKVEFSTDKSKGVFSLSESGMLIFQRGTNPSRTLAWFDRSGKQLEALAVRPVYNGGRTSRQGSKIVFDSEDPEVKTSDVWLFDLARKLSTRLTFDRSDDIIPVWSPDASRIAYASDKAGALDVYVKNADGTENEQRIYQSSDPKYVTDWSPDGKYLLFQAYVPGTYWDLLAVPVQGDHTPVSLLRTEFDEQAGRFSPDGRWVAYQSDESGRPEVYVRPFPSGDGKWQVSSSGGVTPFWRQDGKELLFGRTDGTIEAAAVQGSGTTFIVGSVTTLFAPPPGQGIRLYDVSPDGKRLLMGLVAGGQQLSPLSLLTNWDKELRNQ